MAILDEKGQTVESIFDYNPTEQELKRFGISREKEKKHGRKYEDQIEDMKKVIAEVGLPEYFRIGILFSMRGDKKRAAEYFAKAPRWQQDLLIQDC
jgi:hypothetical protein